MCSASSRVIRSRMSIATSTIKRSALRPERNTRSAISAPSAWVTVAPLSMASLVASVSWPRSVPTIRRRISQYPSWYSGADTASAPLRLDHFRHGHAELLLDQHDLAARDQPVVDVDVDRLADCAVELEHGAGSEPQQVADIHPGAAEHGRDLHRHVEHRFEIGSAAVRFAAVGRERSLTRAWHDVGIPIEFGQGDLGFVTHRNLQISSRAAAACRDIAADSLVDCRFGCGTI